MEKSNAMTKYFNKEFKVITKITHGSEQIDTQAQYSARHFIGSLWTERICVALGSFFN